MTEWSGEAGRMSNTELPQETGDQQSEYYPNDEEDTESPPIDPAVPSVDDGADGS